MARKKKEFPPVKERFIGFRVTEELYEIIESEASQAKMSVSEYCRSLATNKRIILKKENVFDNPELLSALSTHVFHFFNLISFLEKSSLHKAQMP